MKHLLLAGRRWIGTLKFKIVLLALLTGVLAAAGTAAVVIRSTQESIRRVVLAAAAEDRERSADLLGSKVSMLRDALVAVARAAPAAVWQDHSAMGRYLLDKPALGSMFAAVYGADTAGRMLALVEAGQLSSELPDVADRAYFKQTLRSDQPLISEVLWGKVLDAPVVIFAVPVLDRDSRHLGILAGSIALRSTALVADMRASSPLEGPRDLVIDRAGRVVAHPDAARVMRPADAEPGLGATVREWVASGSPIDTRGVATVHDGHVVSIADALCAAVLAYRFSWQGTGLSVGASVGLVAVGAGFAGAADVLRAADAACYEAKKRGRGRVEVFAAPRPRACALA